MANPRWIRATRWWAGEGWGVIVEGVKDLLPVSRRQTRELRDRLVRDPMRSYRDDQ